MCVAGSLKKNVSAFFITQICCIHALEVESGENELLASLLRVHQKIFRRLLEVGGSREEFRMR